MEAFADGANRSFNITCLNYFLKPRFIPRSNLVQQARQLVLLAAKANQSIPHLCFGWADWDELLGCAEMKFEQLHQLPSHKAVAE